MHPLVQRLSVRVVVRAILVFSIAKGEPVPELAKSVLRQCVGFVRAVAFGRSLACRMISAVCVRCCGRFMECASAAVCV